MTQMRESINQSNYLSILKNGTMVSLWYVSHNAIVCASGSDDTDHRKVSFMVQT